jgi:8-oxo-dGTP pyrophosphatase MutT (NUDIX family)
MTAAHRARELWWRLRRPVKIGVRIAALDAGGRVLLVRHTYTPGWFLPGGGADGGETLAQAAARELREEVGLTPLAEPALVGVPTFFLLGKTDHVAIFQAACRGELRVDPREIAQARWFNLDDLPEGLAPTTRWWLAHREGADLR